MQETQTQLLVHKDALEGERTTHSTILAWKIPWTEEPGGLQFMRWEGVGQHTHTHTHTNKPSLSFNTCYFTETLGWHKTSQKRNFSPGDRLGLYILFRRGQKSFLLLLISNKWIPRVWEREAQLNHEKQGTTSIWHFL